MQELYDEDRRTGERTDVPVEQAPGAGVGSCGIVATGDDEGGGST